MAGEVSTGGPQWLGPQTSLTPKARSRNVAAESSLPSAEFMSPGNVNMLQGYYNGTIESIDRLRYPYGLPDLHRMASAQKEHPDNGYAAKSAGYDRDVARKSSRSEEELTMEASQSGKDPEAMVKNMQNIVNRTKGPFTEDFTASYRKAHGGKDPSPGEVNRAYNEAFLKGYTHAHYGFDKLAGIDPDKVHPSFRDPTVSQMFNSFPGSMDVTGTDGKTVKGVNINHLLSGVQWNATSSDSIAALMQKRTVGYGVNSHLAEALKPTGIFGEIHKKGEEPGHSGIRAADSKAMQEEFMNDPVQGMRKFLKDPGKYIAEG